MLRVHGRRFGSLVAVATALAGGPLCAAEARADEPGSPPAPAPAPAPGPPPAPDAIAPIHVDDPMLAPPPPAPRSLASWDEALALIRTTSPDYLTSAQAVRRAQAQREIALSAVLPSITGQGTYARRLLAPLRATLVGLNGNGNDVPFAIVTPPADAFNVGATASWEVLSPRAIYGIGTADENIEVARLSFEDRRRQIATAVVDAILSTLAAGRVAELNRVGLRAALERLVLTRTRLEYGQGTELDVDRATQDVAAARATLISGDESLRRAREALGAALGSPVPMALPAETDLAAFEAAVARTCRLNGDLERRPDLAAARRRVDLAERSVHDAELLFAPSAGVSSNVLYSTAPVLAPQTSWSVGAVLNVPIYDGGARYGALRDSRAALEQARQALVAARLAAVVESARAQRAVGVLEQSRDVARQQRDLAARIDQRTRDGYARGLGTSLDLVVSAQALRQADVDLALLDFQVDDARANAVLVNAECVY
ncbi:MAG: TolC family protein [Polyangiaceae bacterium]|nr:TolC family protein [Polyangiaceae bacterium]